MLSRISLPRIRSRREADRSQTGVLVELRDLRRTYGPQVVLDHVSLRICPGEFVGVVGPSGAGKSTLLKAVMEAADPGRIRIGYVPQVETVDWSFPVTVEQVVLMGRCQAAGGWPWASRAERRMARLLLDRLGLGGFGDHHIAGLSGGQQQRVFLARALIREPQMLVLDEPTSSVDVGTRNAILRLLTELHGDGMTILLTTHQLEGVAAQLPRVVCLNRTVMADGPPAAVLTPESLEVVFGERFTVMVQGGRR